MLISVFLRPYRPQRLHNIELGGGGGRGGGIRELTLDANAMEQMFKYRNRHEGSGNDLVDYSRAPCLGADHNITKYLFISRRHVNQATHAP